MSSIFTRRLMALGMVINGFCLAIVVFPLAIFRPFRVRCARVYRSAPSTTSFLRKEIFFLKNFLSLMPSPSGFSSSFAFFFLSFPGTSTTGILVSGASFNGTGVSDTFASSTGTRVFLISGAFFSGGGVTGSFIIFAGVSFRNFLGRFFGFNGLTTFTGFPSFFVRAVGVIWSSGASTFFRGFCSETAFISSAIFAASCFFSSWGSFSATCSFSSGRDSGFASASTRIGTSRTRFLRLRIIVGFIRVSSISLAGIPRIFFLILATVSSSRELIWLFT